MSRNQAQVLTMITQTRRVGLAPVLVPIKDQTIVIVTSPMVMIMRAAQIIAAAIRIKTHPNLQAHLQSNQSLRKEK
jgi:hypothetical protein